MLISLAFLATLISCAILAPQLLIAISIFAIGISGLIIGVSVIFKSMGNNKCSANACLFSPCRIDDGLLGLIVGLFACVFVIGVCIACGTVVGIIGGLIGGIITSATLLLSKNNDEKKLGGLTLPLSLSFMAIFLVPIIICCTNKNIRENITNFDLKKMMEGVSQEKKIIFGTLLAVTFVALIAISIYLLINSNKIERRNGEKIEITKLVLHSIEGNFTDNNVLDSGEVKNFLKTNQDYKLVDVVNSEDKENQNSDQKSNDDSITLVLTFKPRSGSDEEKKVSVKIGE